MLGKLTKYEFMATARNFLPLYGAIIIISIINRIFVLSDTLLINQNSIGVFSNASNFFRITMNLLFFSIIIAIGVITLLVIIHRFYKNLYGDQGYLMHTLPVPKWQLIASKVVVSAVWVISSGIIIIASILILVSRTNFVFEFVALIKYMFLNLGLITIFEGFVLALVSCCSAILSIYAAISIGHMFNSYRKLWSFGAYIAFSLIESNIVFFGIYVLNKVFTIFNSLLSTDIGSLLFEKPHTILALLIAYELITACVYFFISHVIMNKKLNLQ